MVVSAAFQSPDLVVATLGGVVTSVDQTRLVEWVRQGVRRAGSVRVLVRLEAFGGWNAGASVDDPASWLQDDEGVTRMAIVGRPEWKVAVLTFIAQPLRRMPIEYFETEAAARGWLDTAQERREPL